MVEAISLGKNNPYNNNYSFGSKKIESEESIFLEQRLEEVQDKQGFLGKTWNGIKELTTLGVSASDCEKMLDKYKNGEISFEEAVNYIESYDDKQKNMSGLLSNILTGIGGIAVATTAAVATGGASIGWSLAFSKGAPIGAALKTGINLLDRATNDVDDDAFDLKQMSKDAISGAFTGATSAISSGVGKGIIDGKVSESIFNGVKCGAMCGAMSGASSYLTDAAFQDVDYNTSDLIKNTLFSASVSAGVGGVVGGGMYGSAMLKGAVGDGASTATQTLGQTITKDSCMSSLRKFLGLETKKIAS